MRYVLVYNLNSLGTPVRHIISWDINETLEDLKNGIMSILQSLMVMNLRCLKLIPNLKNSKKNCK